MYWSYLGNNPELIKLLISKGAFVDSKDLGNRTPLIVASKSGMVKCVKTLLAYEANPTWRTFLGYSALDLAASDNIRSYVKKGYLLWISNKFIDKSRRAEVWKKEALEYFEDEKDEGIAFLM